MDKAIRHADGRMISTKEWNTIKASTRSIKFELLQLQAPRSRRGQKPQRKTKTYFRTFHPTEWKIAISKLEDQHPLLTLCSSHWKAEHVLGASLLAVSATHGSDDDDNDNDKVDDADVQDTGHATRRKSRGRSGTQKEDRHKTNQRDMHKITGSPV